MCEMLCDKWAAMVQNDSCCYFVDGISSVNGMGVYTSCTLYRGKESIYMPESIVNGYSKGY